MPGLGAVSATNKAFATGLVPAVGVAAAANFVGAKSIAANSSDAEDLDKKMMLLIAPQLVAGTAMGLGGGITHGRTLREMVPPETAASNLDDFVRHPPSSSEIKALEAAAPKAGALRIGGAGVGMLLGASLGVFALAVSGQAKMPWAENQ